MSVFRFVKKHSDFIGVKIIYSQGRHVTTETFQKYLKTFQQLKDIYPNFVVGFDIVGQEDKGLPLKNFTKQLLELKSEYQKFVFHAGKKDTNFSFVRIIFSLAKKFQSLLFQVKLTGMVSVPTKIL